MFGSNSTTILPASTPPAILTISKMRGRIGHQGFQPQRFSLDCQLHLRQQVVGLFLFLISHLQFSPPSRGRTSMEVSCSGQSITMIRVDTVLQSRVMSRYVWRPLVYASVYLLFIPSVYLLLCRVSWRKLCMHNEIWSYSYIAFLNPLIYPISFSIISIFFS